MAVLKSENDFASLLSLWLQDNVLADGLPSGLINGGVLDPPSEPTGVDLIRWIGRHRWASGDRDKDFGDSAGEGVCGGDGCITFRFSKGELFCETVVFFGGDIWILGAVYRLLSLPSGETWMTGTVCRLSSLASSFELIRISGSRVLGLSSLPLCDLLLPNVLLLAGLVGISRAKLE